MKLACLLVFIETMMPVTAASPYKSMKALSFNAELTNWRAKSRETRRDLMVEYLRGIHSDIVCLQGVWYKSDVDEIANQLADLYPYSSSSTGPLDRAPDTPICPDISVIQDCVAENCSDIGDTSEGIFECVTSKCSAQVMQLSAQCRLCLVFSRNVTDYMRREDCMNPSNETINVYGLMIMSTRKILSSSVRAFDDQFHMDDLADNRGVLEVVIKKIQGLCVCTQLSETVFNLPIFEPRIPQYVTHEVRNMVQVEKLLEMYYNDTMMVLMGSFNTGPGFKCRIVSQFPHSYKILRKATPPFSMSAHGKYTYSKEKRKYAVDHIFVRGHFLRHSHRTFRNEAISYHACVTAIIVVET